MAVKVSSNKTKSSSKKEEKGKNEVKMDTKPEKVKASPVSFSVDPIENGFIVSKQWTDEEGRWQNKRTYFKENPIDIEFEKKG